jgi:hypothetical protein
MREFLGLLMGGLLLALIYVVVKLGVIVGLVMLAWWMLKSLTGGAG